MIRRFPRDVAALDAVFGFIGEFLAQGDIDESESFPIGLIIEELFTNFIRHNQDGSSEIEIRLERAGDEVFIALTDFGVKAWDVTKAPPVDLDRPLAERKPGGLGIHLVRTIADTIAYEFDQGNSTIKITKRLEK